LPKRLEASKLSKTADNGILKGGFHGQVYQFSRISALSAG
jgi:hypothetical protein